MNHQIIVTTGTLEDKHSIIHPIFVQITNRGTLRNQMKRLEKEYEEFIKDLQEKGLIHPESEKKEGMSKKGHSHPTGLHMEKAFYIGIEELKKKAQVLEADAVIHLRYETDILDGDADFYFQMYGTAVRIER